MFIPSLSLNLSFLSQVFCPSCFHTRNAPPSLSMLPHTLLPVLHIATVCSELTKKNEVTGREEVAWKLELEPWAQMGLGSRPSAAFAGLMTLGRSRPCPALDLSCGKGRKRSLHQAAGAAAEPCMSGFVSREAQCPGGMKCNATEVDTLVGAGAWTRVGTMGELTLLTTAKTFCRK